jgi:hypothetical protein
MSPNGGREQEPTQPPSPPPEPAPSESPPDAPTEKRGWSKDEDD